MTNKLLDNDNDMKEKEKTDIGKQEATTPPKRRKSAPNRYGWSDARRRAQAERIRRVRPWENSTGPRTAEGKKRIKQNAVKHGARSRQMTEIKRLLRWQRRTVKDIMADLKRSGFDPETFENQRREEP